MFAFSSPGMSQAAAISSNGLESARDFQPGLVRCTDVTVPETVRRGNGGRPDRSSRPPRFAKVG